MGYRKMAKEDVYEIIRRWHAGQSTSRIAKTEGCDRKTVRKYIIKLLKAGVTRSEALPPKQKLYQIIGKVSSVNKRPRSATEELARFEDELRELIHDPKEPVKPKTAFEIVKIKHNLEVSYETFKIFARQRALTVKPKKQIIRIELPAGLETQIDYGRVGYLQDPWSRKNRVVWAFCGILSCSRYPFIQYVFTQKKESFAESFIDMWEFYGGVTEIASIDNLKAGVIKPDLYDPKLNKSLQEVAEYYGFFIDPCRVGKYTDKGKVERFVPVAREVFRKLKKLHPIVDIHELNEHVLIWCKQEYGQKEHGTTRVAPAVAFEEVEKKKLKRLPEERFEVPVWGQAHVHQGDQFFTFDKKRYALPVAYRGKDVWVRYSRKSRLLYVFYEDELIREYVINSKVINYFPEDFPEGKREMMNGGYPRYLLEKARVYGENSYRLIESVLEPHAYLNARRARGMIEIMKKYSRRPYFEQVCRKALSRRVKLPRSFRAMLEAEERQLALSGGIEISETGKQMVRDIGYYLN